MHDLLRHALGDPLTPLLLGVLCLVLVGPGPLWVVRWRFLTRVPRAAVVLWQAGTVAALAALLAAGAMVAHRLAVTTGARRIAAPAGDTGDPRADPLPLTWWQLGLSVLIVTFTVVVVVRLVWSLVSVVRTTSQRRTRHRTAVDLVGRADRSLTHRLADHSAGDAATALAELVRLGRLDGLRVLAGPTPLAYCLPGLRDHRVVVSEGTLERLDHSELTAVLAHEASHVRSRHDIVLDTFTALHRAFPIVVRSEIPAQECTLLVEMLADDAARRTTGPLPLARALVSLAGSPVPHTALGAGASRSDGLIQRIERLSPDRPGYTRGLAAGVYTLAVALLASPLAVVVGIGVLR